MMMEILTNIINISEQIPPNIYQIILSGMTSLIAIIALSIARGQLNKNAINANVNTLKVILDLQKEINKSYQCLIEEFNSYNNEANSYKEQIEKLKNEIDENNK